MVHDSWLLPTNMAYEKKEYKKRIEGCLLYYKGFMDYADSEADV
jgi:hypothetical protein